MNLLETYVGGWREAADAVIALGAELTDDEWAAPTDCPGWTVKDVYAHLAHLETELSHTTQNAASGSGDAGGNELVSTYTADGVATRAGHSPAELVAELAVAVSTRAELLADLPDDPDLPAPVTPGGIPWSWDTLLRNRSIDMWVHEQDIRRATGRHGGLASAGAQVATMTFSFAMPYVLGKRVRPPADTIVRWDVTGAIPVDLVVQIGADGRATTLDLIDVLDQPSTTLSMNSETFAVLAAGRRGPDQVDVTITGDHELGVATLSAMGVTP